MTRAVERRSQLEVLARKRALARSPKYNNIADYREGAYECAHVSPYSKSACNVESPVFLLLQDWISDDVLGGPLLPDAVTYGRLPKLPTNRNLDRLLLDHFKLAIGETFATNLFPFIKTGDMSASIPFADLRAAARDYALPQIRIIAPRLVIALGLNCANALRAELNLSRYASLDEAIATPFEALGARIWCQAHPGALGQNGRNRGRNGQVNKDWAEMAAWYQKQA